MGLFSKEKCSICGKESRWLDFFEDTTGEKHLCDSCKAKMKVAGYAEYRNYTEKYLGFAKYDDILKYSKYVSDLKQSGAVGNDKFASVFEVDSFCINTDFISVYSYDNLIIDTKDVFAVCIENAPGLSSTFVEAMVLTIFTTNPLIPFISIVTAGKKEFFSIMKAKKYREYLVTELELMCPNIKYTAMSAREMKKFIKNDSTSVIEKKVFKEYVSDLQSGYGKLNPSKILRYQRETAPEWVLKLHNDLGYKYFVK